MTAAKALTTDAIALTALAFAFSHTIMVVLFPSGAAGWVAKCILSAHHYCRFDAMMRHADAIRIIEIGITSHRVGAPFALSVMVGRKWRRFDSRLRHGKRGYVYGYATFRRAHKAP